MASLIVGSINSPSFSTITQKLLFATVVNSTFISEREYFEAFVNRLLIIFVNASKSTSANKESSGSNNENSRSCCSLGSLKRL